MQEFKSGQRVKVEYEGTVVSAGTYSLMLKMDGGQERAFRVDAPELKLTLLDPADWPPRPGDVWEAEGRDWFGRYVAGLMGMVPEDNNMCLELKSFKGLNPVLVRRRGQ